MKLVLHKVRAESVTLSAVPSECTEHEMRGLSHSHRSGINRRCLLRHRTVLSIPYCNRRINAEHLHRIRRDENISTIESGKARKPILHSHRLKSGQLREQSLRKVIIIHTLRHTPCLLSHRCESGEELIPHSLHGSHSFSPKTRMDAFHELSLVVVKRFVRIEVIDAGQLSVVLPCTEIEERHWYVNKIVAMRRRLLWSLRQP